MSRKLQILEETTEDLATQLDDKEAELHKLQLRNEKLEKLNLDLTQKTAASSELIPELKS